MTKSSRIPGYHQLSRDERLRLAAEFGGLTAEEARALERGLSLDTAQSLAENVVGTHNVPLGIATNFILNRRELLIPMAVEESSVIAAASHAAKIARPHGGFTAESSASVMIGQVQLLGVPDVAQAERAIQGSLGELQRIANDPQSTMVKEGGGLQALECRRLDTPRGAMLVVHLLIDVRDAMGANAVNTIAETLAPILAELSGGRANLRILSNLADRRLATARAIFDKDELGGDRVVENILDAWAFADADPYRAATHNKGIMNGVDAVVVATGNDWRAIEAGCHAYAARTGRYRALSVFTKRPDGHLEGVLELPLALGTVGGTTKVDPSAQAALKLLGSPSARQLAEIACAVGLAQNLAALRALSDEGIQKGHMALHATNLALMAGAVGDEVQKVADALVREGKVRMRRAAEILAELRARR
ncbi:MAG TPA: hydroxymethylglutaryl-CoA reductase, degradative [Candidatus Thermoplasmatota archaeon]|nr:hydroxymethylglutaryl-CoA reductase, degradative [Candidatus Thermoplasmatota archaeon]